MRCACRREVDRIIRGAKPAREPVRTAIRAVAMLVPASAILAISVLHFILPSDISNFKSAHPFCLRKADVPHLQK